MAVNVVTKTKVNKGRQRLNIGHIDPDLLNVDETTEKVVIGSLESPFVAGRNVTADEDGMRVTRNEFGDVVSQSFGAGEDYITEEAYADMDRRYLARKNKGVDDVDNEAKRAEEIQTESLSPQPAIVEREQEQSLHNKIGANQRDAVVEHENRLQRGADADENIAPDLTPEQMQAHLNNFINSEYNGTITPQEVTQNPALYKEFGMYLGRQEGIIDFKEFVDYRNAKTTGERTPTFYMQPQIGGLVDSGPAIEQIPGFGSTSRLRSLVDGTVSLTNSANENNNNFHFHLGSKIPTIEGEIGELSTRFHKAVSNVFTTMGPKEADTWASRIAGDHPGSNVESIKEMMYWYFGNYAKIEEARRLDPDHVSSEVDRGLTDVGWLASILTAKRQAYNTIEDKDFQEFMNSDNARQTDLMNAGLDAQIGHLVFEGMGLINDQTDARNIVENADGSASIVEADPTKEESLRDYKKWLGSFVRNVTGDIFSYTPQIKDWDQSTGERILAYDIETGKPIYKSEGEGKEFNIFKGMLFEVVPSVKATDKNGDLETNDDGTLTNRMTQRGVRLTESGLKVALEIEPLTNLLFPSTRVEPRFKKEETFLKNREGKYINWKGKLLKKGEDPVPVWNMNAAQIRKFRGTQAYKQQGSVVKQSFNMHIKAMAGARVGDKALGLLNAIYNDENAQSILDGPEYLGMSGDGLPATSEYSRGKGERGNRTRQRVLRGDKGEILYNTDGSPKMEFFIGDFLKDKKLSDTLSWAINNRGKVFYFDYFVGQNRREFVKQTLFNYQNDKSTRGLLEAGEPRVYSFNPNKTYDLPTGKISEMDYFKAQILRKHGEKGNVFELAERFNDMAELWSMLYDAENFTELAKIGEQEGYMSISAIAEAISLYKAEQVFAQGTNPNQKGTYISGFLAEADGLTNGMAHSSLQTGDPRLAKATLLFVENQKRRILDEGYDGMTNPDAYIIGYEKTRSIAAQVMGGKKFGEVITQQTNESIQKIVERYDKYNTNRKFTSAITVLKKHNSEFGRKFAKSPVMIFGYGAGPAMIRSAVKEFLYEWFENQPGGQDVKAELEALPNFELERDFIQPMGVIMTEALHVEFADVLQLSQTLSKAAVAAVHQGFPLNTFSGQGWAHPFGVIDTNPSEKYKSYTKSFHKVGLDFQPNEVGQILPTSIVEDTSQAHKVKVGNTDKNFDPAGSFVAGALKAGTQISVLMNHGNDSFNMGDSMTDVHLFLAQQGDKAVAHHVFDAILAPPQDLRHYVRHLNDKFLSINRDNSHVMAVYDSLTYKMDQKGDKFEDDTWSDDDSYLERDNISPQTEKHLSMMQGFNDSGTQYQRNLNLRRMKEDGVEMVNGFPLRRTSEGKLRLASTWDQRFDQYAFNWMTPETTMVLTYKNPTSGEYIEHEVNVEDTSQTLQIILDIEKRRQDMFNDGFAMAFQFNDGSI